MSVDSIENSIDDSAGTELFHFYQTNNNWRYCNDREVAFQGNIFEALPIKRGNLKKTATIESVLLEIVADGHIPVAELFRVQAPIEPLRLDIYLYHSETEYAIVWRGRVGSARWSGDETVMTSDNVFSSLRRLGLRNVAQIQCPYALYGAGCEVNPALYELTTTVSSVGNTSVTVPALSGQAENYYAGGKITWDRNGIPESRLIRSSASAGGVLQVAGYIVGMAAGQTVRVYPGCDHSQGANGCAKFNNLLNYGGYPYIPNTPNPFDGGNIW